MHYTKALALALAGTAALGGCVTKKTFRREIGAVRAEITAGDSTERYARMAGDSAIRAEVAALRTELDSLRTQYGARITAMEDGIQFAMPVNFGFDDANVRPEDQAMLDRFASVVQKHYGSSLVTVEGFADPAGSAQYNLSLSRRRADAVRDYLTGRGLTADQLKTVGYGEARLVTPNAERDEPGAEQNRRVVFVIETRGQAAQVTSAVLGTE